MFTRFLIGVIAGFGSFILAFEAAGVEVALPLPDGSNLRVGRKLAALVTEGSSAARSKQYNIAISSFTAALETNPDKSIASLTHYNRGVVYGLIGNTDKAINDYTAAIELNPKYRSAYCNRGAEYAKKHNYKLAVSDETMAIQLNPKYANAYHNRGSCYAEIGEFEKAIADFSQAIRLNPRSASTFDGRALAYESLGQFGKAMADYDRVIRTAPQDADDYAVRGSAYFKKANYKEAHLLSKRPCAFSQTTIPHSPVSPGFELRVQTLHCGMAKRRFG
jgi:tetratricopeptide (TPR) repeat protein